MAMTDPVSDLLTRIRNAAQEGHEKVEIPASRIKANLVRVLKEEGFIRNFRLLRDERQLPVIKVYLKYDDSGESVIKGIRRVSRPGLRRYSGYRQMPKMRGAYRVAIFTTSKGVMTAKKARTENVGGEILCEVW